MKVTPHTIEYVETLDKYRIIYPYKKIHCVFEVNNEQDVKIITERNNTWHWRLIMKLMNFAFKSMPNSLSQKEFETIVRNDIIEEFASGDFYIVCE